jgi:type III restriction enzyme
VAARASSRGFLIITPGITIRDRLRVLLPDDPENYYRTRELLPPDWAARARRSLKFCEMQIHLSAC